MPQQFSLASLDDAIQPLGLARASATCCSVQLIPRISEDPQRGSRDVHGEARGTESLQTLRWRKMDSNFQYAEAVKLVVAPFSCADCLGWGRRADRRAAVQLLFIDIDRLTPSALSDKPFDGAWLP